LSGGTKTIVAKAQISDMKSTASFFIKLLTEFKKISPQNQFE
jgi:hypothetical protein